MMYLNSVIKSRPPVALIRVVIFLATLAFLAGSIYCVVTDSVPRKLAHWQWFGIAVVVLGFLDTAIGDYAGGVYGTVPGSLLYGFFLLLSTLIVLVRGLGFDLAVVVFTPIVLVIGLVILLRDFDLFE